MSQFSINQYYSEVENIIHFGGAKNETTIRYAFKNLLNEYAKAKGLMVIDEAWVKGSKGKNVKPDGILKDSLRQDWGYWESKDEEDVMDDEIKKKFDKGYPKDNILFEDGQTAVLYQNGTEKMRVSMLDPEALELILNTFIRFERPEVQTFRKAIEHFKEDIPKVTEAIRAIIEEAEKTNEKYKKAASVFLKLCHDSINPDVTMADVREMSIQHILTQDIFNTIFDEIDFHRENNIARQLETVIDTFFTGALRKATLAGIKHYYDVINSSAAGIADHHEKQKFLKVVYETFYKSYNPKAADRLGVVYTPNEVVRFMVESTDYLLHKHFNKLLQDKGVEILDPATGTGTFICDIIDYLRKDKLEYKYANEMHANEVAILPYYISNLNIEYTYKQKTGHYKEFENLCFVDTLDNMGFGFAGKQLDIFSAMTEENSKRINRQNGRKISVVIGNPPYNAKQENYNYQNSNRAYEEIDKRIKESFIKYGTAQNQIVVYDMYTRFYRWAFDRLDGNGIIAFITNRSFIDSRAFDGFRKCIQNDFDYAYIVDTKSDVRANTKIAGTTHNIFGIQTGVAIMFLVHKAKQENKVCDIHYISLDDYLRKEEKLQWLSENALKDIAFERVIPDKNNNWINIGDTDWDKFLPLIDKNVKAGKSEKALFKLYSRGVATQRDEWVYDYETEGLKNKMLFFIEIYQKTLSDLDFKDKYTIKWDDDLENYLRRRIDKKFDERQIVKSVYRPFNKKYLYFDKHFNGRTYQWYNIFSKLFENRIIAFNVGSNNFITLSTDTIIQQGSLLIGGGSTQCLPLFSINSEGQKEDNITNWGLNQFTKQYKTKKITKEDIFHYTYAVLHNPAYRKKYELNLKREFPRIPFYDDFFKWAAWGNALMELHIGYENTQPYDLEEITVTLVENPKTRLKALKETGAIAIDENTTLTGIPKEAWLYKLGTRSAIEWILDQYKESKPKDPTIAEKFNTYRFADYKKDVIELIKKVCTVSVETMKIIKEIENS